MQKVAQEEKCAFFDMTGPWWEYIRNSGKTYGWFMGDRRPRQRAGLPNHRPIAGRHGSRQTLKPSKSWGGAPEDALPSMNDETKRTNHCEEFL